MPSIREHAQAALEALASVDAHPHGVVKFALEHLREILRKDLAWVHDHTPGAPLVFEVATLQGYDEIAGQPGVIRTHTGRIMVRELPWLPPFDLQMDTFVPSRTITVTDRKQVYLVEEIFGPPGADWQVVEVRFKRGAPVRVYDRPIGSVAKALRLVEED